MTPMWKIHTLSFVEYKDLCVIVSEFVSDMNKLRALQHTSHLPLILARRSGILFHLASAPRTLDVLSEIDHRFSCFNKGVRVAPVDLTILDTHEVVLGNKQAYRGEVKRMAGTYSVQPEAGYSERFPQLRNN